MRHLVLATLLSLALAAPALAQDRTPPPDVEYTFGDDTVTGDLNSPMVDIIRSRTRSRRTTLIRARAHFVPELTRTLENI